MAGNTCYCGNALNYQPSLASDQSGASDVPCSGNSAEFCGGSSLLQLYATSTLSSGLIITSTPASTSSMASSMSLSTVSSSRSVAPTVVPTAGGVSQAILTGSIAVVHPLTVEACASACSNYNFFGVESSSQCYCGNALSYQPSLASDQSGALDYTCEGASTEYCGGQSLLQLYGKAGYSPSQTAGPTASSSSSGSLSSAMSSGMTSSSMPPSSVTSSSISSTSASPTVVATVGNYVNRGLYNDPSPSSNPLLPISTPVGTPFTVQRCALACSAYQYFGVENGLSNPCIHLYFVQC